MKSYIKHVLTKILFITLLFIVGSIVMLPSSTSMAQTCAAGEQVHIVSSGENLFRISLRYGVTMNAIASRNGIADITRIFAGQILCIPAGGIFNAGAGTQPVIQVVVVIDPSTIPNLQQPPTTANTVPTTGNAIPIVNPAAPVTPPQPNEANWCLNGGPWDDGRCIIPGNPALQDYWFLAGWCQAQAQLGRYPGTGEDCLNGVSGTGSSSSSFDFSLVDDVNNNDIFNCTVIYNRNTGVVTSLAKWDDDMSGQDQVLFFTNLPDLANYAVSVGDDDEMAGTTNTTNPHKTFNRASAKLTIKDGMDLMIEDCDRIIR